MIIDFMGHAGFSIKTKTHSLLVDPWLISSSFENPILHSFAPDRKTIDYLIPEPIHQKEDFSPSVILISHFHTHHSPAAEIDYWLTHSSKKITLIGPQSNNPAQKNFENWFKEKYPTHELILVDTDTTLHFDDVEINCLTHTISEHFAYLIKANGKSFLHLADPMASKIWYDRRIDPAWFKFKNLNPDFLTLTVSSTTYFQNTDGIPQLKENSFLSPVEASQIAKLIDPKNVAIMGIFNFSIWRNRVEYSYPSYEIEGYFRWALHHLVPHIAVQLLRPGFQFSFDDQQEMILKVKTQRKN